MKTNMTITQKPTFLHPEAALVDTLASQCVKCALCLPHCPTYKVTEDENESPRGRIALFQAIAQEVLPLDAKAKKHLDLCLGCSACERVCPAKVEYGELLDHGRFLFNIKNPALQQNSRTFWVKSFTALLHAPSAMRVLHWLLWGIDRCGLRYFANMTAFTRLLGLHRFEQILPAALRKPRPLHQHYAPLNPHRGTVMLFVGCLTPLCDQETLRAAIHVLRYCGYAVIVPPAQNCCGAVDRHAGDLNTAKTLAKTNQTAFAPPTDIPIDAIVSLATGCTVVLGDYQPNVVDLVSFLVHQAEIPATQLQPISADVGLHTPCTRRNILRECSDGEKLLQKIPGLRLYTIMHQDCCGAAGTYMLEHPHMADVLADNLLISIENTPLDFIATTNIGCALHLQQRLNQIKKPLKLVHPVVLLAQSLQPL